MSARICSASLCQSSVPQSVTPPDWSTATRAYGSCDSGRFGSLQSVLSVGLVCGLQQLCCWEQVVCTQSTRVLSCVAAAFCLSPCRYQEETRKAIESINAVMSHLGAAAVELLTDTNKLLMLVAGGSALALGVYGAREGARVAGKAAERWLGTPKLVRETSRQALMRGAQSLLPAAAKTLDQVGGW